MSADFEKYSEYWRVEFARRRRARRVRLISIALWFALAALIGVALSSWVGVALNLHNPPV